MKNHPKPRKGFTLIELLTAVAITTVIVGVLIGATRMSMDAWKDSSDRARASRLAQESIEVMARDLEGIVVRGNNPYEWLYAKMDSSEANGPSDNAKIKNPLEFAFLTAATDRYEGRIGEEEDKGGDISTVLYRLAYKDQLDPVGQTFPVYSLYRQLVNPDETFENYLAKETIQGVTDSDTVTEVNNFIAENVYNLTVTLIFEYETNGVLTQKRVPIMSSGSDFSEVSIKGDGVSTPGSSSSLPKEARLSGAELGILVITDSGMKSLNKKGFRNSEKFAEFIKKNSYYFTKSVVLPRP